MNYFSFFFRKKIILTAFLVSGFTLIAIWLYFNYFFGHNSGFLQNYKLIDGPLNIADTAQQSSGLAYNPDNNLLYVIVNNAPEIHILSSSGKYIRKIDLKGFEDTEGITYLGNNKFAIISERTGMLSWFRILPDTTIINYDPTHAVKILNYPPGNTGIEGVSYAAKTGRIFVIKERKPKKIAALQWPVKNIKQPVITIPWDAEALPNKFLRSLSGISYNNKTGHLFILSRRSRQIIEYTLTGKEVGSFSLKIGSGNLQAPIKKAEGIVISPDGTLYICGEPNQLYIFKKEVN